MDSIPDAPITMDTIVISDEEESGDKNKKAEGAIDIKEGTSAEEKAEESGAEKKDVEKRDSDLDSLGEQKLAPQADTPSKVKLRLKTNIFGTSEEKEGEGKYLNPQLIAEMFVPCVFIRKTKFCLNRKWKHTQIGRHFHESGSLAWWFCV